MVQEIATSCNLCRPFRVLSFRGLASKPSRILLGFIAWLAGAASAEAQNSQQQYVYASVPVTTATSEVVGFSVWVAGCGGERTERTGDAANRNTCRHVHNRGRACRYRRGRPASWCGTNDLADLGGAVTQRRRSSRSRGRYFATLTR
jgi:hypothetical protein